MMRSVLSAPGSGEDASVDRAKGAYLIEYLHYHGLVTNC